jgi:P4 family phage/plasmid primase-like protien
MRALGVYQKAKEIVRADKGDANQTVIDRVIRAARDGLATRGERPLDRQDDTDNTYMDDSPLLLCTRNGVVNLESGLFEQHSPAYLMTKSCTVEYHEGAECKMWLDHLDRLFDGNEETIAFFRRLLSQALIGRLRDKEPVFLWLYGASGTGKTTACEVFTSLLGSYAKVQNASTFTKKWQHTSALEMYGIRVALVDDADSVDVDELKRQTGSDTRHGQPGMGQDFREYVQSTTLLFTSNYALKHEGKTEGLDRRYRPIKCTDTPVHIVRATKSWRDALMSEGAGILAWLVEDCEAYQHEGLPIPKHLEELRVNLLTIDIDEADEALADWIYSIEAAPGDVPVSRKALRTSLMEFKLAASGTNITDKAAFKYLREIVKCDSYYRKVTIPGAEGPKQATERGFMMAKWPTA